MSAVTTRQRVALVLTVFIVTVATPYVLIGLGMDQVSGSPMIASFIIGIALGMSGLKMLSARTNE